MTRLVKYLGQGIIFALSALFIGYFSASPAYWQLPEGAAMIKLSFAHAGEKKEPCRVRSDEEMASQAPNMRRRRDCPRERLPLVLEFEMDGETVLHEILQPTGLSRDLASRIYEKFPVPVGRHSLTLRLRDTARPEGYDYEQSFEIDLQPAQNLAIDFRADLGGFVLK
jgi:hypothetical protein